MGDVEASRRSNSKKFKHRSRFARVQLYDVEGQHEAMLTLKIKMHQLHMQV